MVDGYAGERPLAVLCYSLEGRRATVGDNVEQLASSYVSSSSFDRSPVLGLIR